MVFTQQILNHLNSQRIAFLLSCSEIEFGKLKQTLLRIPCCQGFYQVFLVNETWIKAALRIFQEKFSQGSDSTSLYFLAPALLPSSRLLKCLEVWQSCCDHRSERQALKMAEQGAWILDDTVGPLLWLHVPLDQ